MNNILLNKVIPFVLKDPVSGWTTTDTIIIALTKEDSLIGIIAGLGYSVKKFKGDFVKSYFKASLKSDGLWVAYEKEHYFSEYPILVDSQLPKNWKEKIEIEEGNTFFYSRASNC